MHPTHFPYRVFLLLTRFNRRGLAPAPRAVCLAQEVPHVHTQRLGHPKEVADLHFLASLHALNGVAGKARGLPQSLLCPAEVGSAETNAVADRPAGVEDPRGMVWRHEIHALPLLILCQPQFWGIS